MVRKIKVCFVAIYAWALFSARGGSAFGGNPDKKLPFGGSEVQLYQLSKELAKDKSFKVSFIVGDFGQAGKVNREGISIYKGFSPSYSSKQNRTYVRDLRQTLQLWRALNQTKADIYVQRSAGAETGITALFCRLFRKKFVYMVAHEKDVSGEYVRKNALRGKLFAWGIKQANLVVVQNQEQNELLKQNFQRDSILVKSVYYIESVDTVRKDFILWVGRCVDWKRPELFHELARYFPEEHFIMICSPSPYQANLFYQIRNSAQEIPNLKFVEYVPFAEIDRYFREAKVLINTSDYEGFPNTFIQATKNKTPILSFKVNPDDFISQYQLGYCAEGSFDRMTDQLRELLRNKSLWEKMSENAFRYAKENHDINKVVPEFKELLKAVVNK